MTHSSRFIQRSASPLTLLLIAPLLVAGCAAGSSSVRKGDAGGQASGFINRLVTDSVEISLPEGWFLTLPEEEDELKLSLYDIKRMDGLGSGWIGKVPLSGDAEYDMTARVWVESVEEVNGTARVEHVKLDGRKATLTWSTDSEGLEQRDAVILESDAIYIVSLQMVAGYLTGNHSAPDAIFRGLKASSGNVSMRRIQGLPSFSCVDGVFSWYSDLDTAPGWTAFANNVGVLTGISVAASFAGSLEEHAASLDGREFTLGYHDTRIPIGNEWFDARVGGFVSEGHYYLVYFFKRGGQAYLLNLITSTDSPDIDPRTFHNLPAVRSYLKKYVSF